jgi:ubiquinone/menaquinone biosynthesis C-methylase UbiE
MVEEASKKNKNFIDKKRASFIHADANNLPFENNSFDKIFTVNTFYFWDNHSSVLAELKRVLKKDGSLIISIRPSHNLEKFPVTKYDFSILSQQEILKLLNTNGFNSIEITEIKEPNQPHFGGMGERECTIFSCSLQD